MQGVASSSSSLGPSLEGIDDVEDFPWANEGESSMSWDRFSHLYDLMQMGNTAFRENRLDEAINCYSKANNIKPNDPIILSNRCASYLRYISFCIFFSYANTHSNAISAHSILLFQNDVITSSMLVKLHCVLDEWTC
nr:LON peptidase N-terminal domain and RING finger protein 1 [Ipomoea trifida]